MNTKQSYFTEFFTKMKNKKIHDEKVTEMKNTVDKLFSSNQDGINENTMKDVIHQKDILDVNANVRDAVFIPNDNMYNDVEFFSKLSDKTKSVFDSINNCKTVGGKCFSENIYKNLTCNIKTLRKRSECLLNIESKYLLQKERVDVLIDVLKTNEKHILWLFEEKEETINELYSMVFFRLKGLKPLNNFGSALTSYNIYRILISPLFGIIAPVMYFIIPYLIVMYRFKISIPFTVYMKTMFYSAFSSSETLLGDNTFLKYVRIISYLFSAVFYFQGIFTSIDVAKTVNKMSKLIITNFNAVIDYLAAAKELENILWDSTHISAYVNNTNVDIKTETTESANEQTFVSNLLATKQDYHIFSNFGSQLKSYKTVDLKIISRITRKSYILDGLIGAIRFKLSNDFSITNFKSHSLDQRPYISFEQMVHPCLDLSKAVQNDVKFGVIDGEQNSIITAPNSSGKSILIKSIIVNVLMSQSMGISCSRKASMTPFRFINTQINVPDSTGHESLFEAEMHRCKYTFDMLKKVKSFENFESSESSESLKALGDKNDYSTLSLIVMDEIFNSTNPVEAIAGAYAVCKRIASIPSNILIFTTHFNYLTKLAKEPQCKFVNYRMGTFVDDKTKDIDFTYKFERGVNKHLLALEILRKSGFEDSILDDAIAIKNKLMANNKKETRDTNNVIDNNK
jgi:DNA mismatch repair ATPase MutS